MKITRFIYCSNCDPCFSEDIPTVAQMGNWGCWSQYSECVGGKRSRSRNCNTEGLQGASCAGERTSEEYC